jgi:hypothetical protein
MPEVATVAVPEIQGMTGEVGDPTPVGVIDDMIAWQCDEHTG